MSDKTSRRRSHGWAEMTLRSGATAASCTLRSGATVASCTLRSGAHSRLVHAHEAWASLGISDYPSDKRKHEIFLNCFLKTNTDSLCWANNFSSSSVHKQITFVLQLLYKLVLKLKFSPAHWMLTMFFSCVLTDGYWRRSRHLLTWHDYFSVCLNICW